MPAARLAGFAAGSIAASTLALGLSDPAALWVFLPAAGTVGTVAGAALAVRGDHRQSQRVSAAWTLAAARREALPPAPPAGQPPAPAITPDPWCESCNLRPAVGVVIAAGEPFAVCASCVPGPLEPTVVTR